MREKQGLVHIKGASTHTGTKGPAVDSHSGVVKKSLASAQTQAQSAQTQPQSAQTQPQQKLELPERNKRSNSEEHTGELAKRNNS